MQFNDTTAAKTPCVNSQDITVTEKLNSGMNSFDVLNFSFFFQYDNEDKNQLFEFVRKPIYFRNAPVVWEAREIEALQQGISIGPSFT